MIRCYELINVPSLTSSRSWSWLLSHWSGLTNVNTSYKPIWRKHKCNTENDHRNKIYMTRKTKDHMHKKTRTQRIISTCKRVQSAEASHRPTPPQSNPPPPPPNVKPFRWEWFHFQLWFKWSLPHWSSFRLMQKEQRRPSGHPRTSQPWTHNFTKTH